MSGEAPKGAPLEELWAALAEADAQSPPRGMGGRVLAAALRRRPAGRPAVAVPAISPLGALQAQVAALDGLLASLDVADWHRPALRDLDVQGLVGHLIGVERDFQRALDSAGMASRATGRDGDAATDHVASTQSVALAQSGVPVEHTHAEWRAAAACTVGRLTAEGAAIPAAPIGMHGVTLPLHDWLVVRAFELWTHEEDVRRATGRDPSAPGSSAVRLMTDLAVAMLPAGVERVGASPRGGAVRLVLTGEAGGCWTVPVGSPSGDPATARIVTDAVDFCRVAAARTEPAALDATITGDAELALLLLRGTFSLALD